MERILLSELLKQWLVSPPTIEQELLAKLYLESSQLTKNVVFKHLIAFVTGKDPASHIENIYEAFYFCSSLPRFVTLQSGLSNLGATTILTSYVVQNVKDTVAEQNAKLAFMRELKVKNLEAFSASFLEWLMSVQIDISQRAQDAQNGSIQDFIDQYRSDATLLSNGLVLLTQDIPHDTVLVVSNFVFYLYCATLLRIATSLEQKIHDFNLDTTVEEFSLLRVIIQTVKQQDIIQNGGDSDIDFDIPQNKKHMELLAKVVKKHKVFSQFESAVRSEMTEQKDALSDLQDLSRDFSVTKERNKALKALTEIFAEAND